MFNAGTVHNAWHVRVEKFLKLTNLTNLTKLTNLTMQAVKIPEYRPPELVDSAAVTSRSSILTKSPKLRFMQLASKSPKIAFRQENSYCAKSYLKSVLRAKKKTR